MNIDLENAGVGGDRQADEAGIDSAEGSPRHDRPTERNGRSLDDAQQIDRMFHVLDRRQEHEDVALACLDAKRGAGQALRLDLLGLGAPASGGRLLIRQRGVLLE